jgi:hypothetical protein
MPKRARTWSDPQEQVKVSSLAEALKVAFLPRQTYIVHLTRNSLD